MVYKNHKQATIARIQWWKLGIKVKIIKTIGGWKCIKLQNSYSQLSLFS